MHVAAKVRCKVFLQESVLLKSTEHVVATVIYSCMNFAEPTLYFYVNILRLQKLQFNFGGALEVFSIVIKGCTIDLTLPGWM